MRVRLLDGGTATSRQFPRSNAVASLVTPSAVNHGVPLRKQPAGKDSNPPAFDSHWRKARPLLFAGHMPTRPDTSGPVPSLELQAAATSRGCR
jgi:hypothetical protein